MNWRKTVSIILIGVAALLFLLSIYPWLSPPTYDLWKVRLASEEWGGWCLVAAALLTFGMSLALLKQGRRALYVALGLTVSSIGFFSLPLVDTWQTANECSVPLSPLRFFAGSPKYDSEKIKDVQYAPGLTLDVHLPSGHKRHGAVGAVLIVHGGGWNHGSKGDYEKFDRWLTTNGFAVFDVNYRLAGPESRFPVPADDVATAFKWAQSHASEYGVDPKRIALLGRSAGAQLALLTAYNSSRSATASSQGNSSAPTGLASSGSEASSSASGASVAATGASAAAATGASIAAPAGASSSAAATGASGTPAIGASVAAPSGASSSAAATGASGSPAIGASITAQSGASSSAAANGASAAASAGCFPARAVIAFYGPTDLVWGYRNIQEPDVINSRFLLENYLGGTPETARQAYDTASPLGRVTAGSAPTLLVHGKRDNIVSVHHAEMLVANLQKAGVPAEVLVLPAGDHAFDINFDGWNSQIEQEVVLRFLRRHLDDTVSKQ